MDDDDQTNSEPTPPPEPFIIDNSDNVWPPRIYYTRAIKPHKEEEVFVSPFIFILRMIGYCITLGILFGMGYSVIFTVVFLGVVGGLNAFMILAGVLIGGIAGIAVGLIYGILACCISITSYRDISKHKTVVYGS